ncbi:Ribosomal RNA large subunit methyltransferase H [Aquicella siphonis]|uniref:Ribosomal RNA large subunit methyltransferase H n=1 Tax=Aquicella siphonis TaxID=254247 RepID=A0A5E4PIG3_9COXI|nr:23S rRNA (pseudouridine(1915)-N(3))-methyltransferase RlmH [Aquicella siphonis]VVC76238.1 Ribosomal RNA large subunit methyltransferase H [Aquicella siphonis]
MKIRLLTITHKSPAWIREGYEEYAKRLPATCQLELVEIPAEKRTPHADLRRITEREGEKMLNAVKPGHKIIALDIKGSLWTTEQLAEQLALWHQGGRHIDLLVGGPDGLSPACLIKAEQKWSLSPLTFPHFLVRLIVAEQIYRAYSILIQHPYHR